MVLINSTPS
ncbi:hypothetical protein AYI68_g6813, partial [Smittium mucronatum]